MQGEGEMVYATTNHYYKGWWRDNKKHGHGFFRFVDGNTYEGEYCDDIQHGKGKLTYSPGNILEESYDGDWVDGEGTVPVSHKFQDPIESYEGEWCDNLRHGTGKLIYKDGG